MKITKPIITLALALITLTACQNDALDDTGTQMRDINISIPALQTATRTTTDPNNPLKTTWDVGDVVYISVIDFYSLEFIAKLTAQLTDTGWQFSSKLQVPMERQAICIDATYIGNHQPGELCFDTDVLYSGVGYSLRGVLDEVTFTLREFNHFCPRIRFTGLAEGDQIEFQGNQWNKITVNAGNYRLGMETFATTDHLTVASGQDEAVVYVYIYPRGTTAPQFRINGGQWYTFDYGTPNPEGSTYYNRTYTIDCAALFGGGGIGDMPQLVSNPLP